MPMTTLGAAPSRAVPSTFAALADALLSALPNFVTEANALEVNVNTRENLATAAAAVADAAADIALAAANYKGAWSAQVGAANVPYAVSHLGKFWMLASNLVNVAAKTPGTDPEWLDILVDYSCENLSEQIQYPIPTSGYMLKAATDGSPAVGTNTDTEVASAVSLKHTQHTDTGTTATSFKINSGGNEADLQTTGLTADRDYTLPDVDTMLAGAVLEAENLSENIPYATETHIADAKVDYATPGLDTEAEVISAFNTTNGKINSILAILENAGIVKTA